jgi:radical SAM protein with 4Fe4S-binding SPASM domain
MGVGRVEFSVDGATRDVYERIRAGSSYDRVTGNIRHLAQYKKIRGAPIPILRLNVVLMRSNIHQLPDLVDLAADLGVEELLCQHMIVFADLLRDESLVLEKQRSNDYVRAAAQRATERQIRFYHPPLFDLPHQVLPAAVPAAALAARSEADVIYAAAGDYNFQRKANDETGPKAARCTDPWRKVAFDWQGLVFPCCAWKGQPIGDISKTSFAEIWNSPEYRQLRRGLTRGPVPGPCLQCSAISGGNVNQESAFLFG